MRYRRALLVTELGADPAAALAAVRGVAPAAERLVVLARPPVPPSSWPEPAGPAGATEAVSAWLDGLREAASDAAAEVVVQVVPELGAERLADVAAALGCELVVAGPRTPEVLPALAELRRRRPVAVLWTAAASPPRTDRRLTELFCVALGERAERSVARFLRHHGDRGQHVTVLTLSRPERGELFAALEATDLRAAVTLLGPGGLPPWRALDALSPGSGAELVVLARFPPLLLRGARWPAPVLVLPALAPARPALLRPIDVPDLVDDGGVLRVRIGYAYGVGRNPPVDDQEIAFVSADRITSVAVTQAGEAELPAGEDAGLLGVFRVRHQGGAEPAAAVERQVAVIRPGTLPLVLFDVDLPDEELAALARTAGHELLAVRLRPARSCHLLRERLAGAGLAPRVIDANAVLAEGDAADVGEALDPVRLARVATRLLGAGFPVAAIVHGGPTPPDPVGCAALRTSELAGRSWPCTRVRPRPASLGARLDATTGATSIAGNRVELELENATGRAWLLETIAGATRRVHLQTYMATDDGLGRRVEAALRGAAGRGVTVRVLVDSLHGLHGSFGLRNPLLERLSACPGVEVRVSKPVWGFPSIEDLKQRDHRKLVVADGRVALVGGRNLAHEYYTGFAEVEVTPRTPWREVPWLDAGGRVEGPAVAPLERAFLEAWTGAGGEPFGVEVPPTAGPVTARVVVHRGLRDAATLETYLALVESARSHVVAVNGFPLLLELQHAFVRALRRGVRVRTLFGNVAPTHGGERFEGQGTVAGSVATALVHSRMDALVAAGAEGYQLALRDVPGWDPDLGLVQPHVHAKAMSADGRVVALGSANLDVTASYWESELLLVLEDEPLARAFEASVDRLVAGSVRVNRSDPAWQRLARRREWLRHWPGVLSV